MGTNFTPSDADEAKPASFNLTAAAKNAERLTNAGRMSHVLIYFLFTKGGPVRHAFFAPHVQPEGI